MIMTVIKTILSSPFNSILRNSSLLSFLLEDLSRQIIILHSLSPFPRAHLTLFIHVLTYPRQTFIRWANAQCACPIFQALGFSWMNRNRLIKLSWNINQINMVNTKHTCSTAGSPCQAALMSRGLVKYGWWAIQKHHDLYLKNLQTWYDFRWLYVCTVKQLVDFI